MDAPLASVNTSWVPITDIHVYFRRSYYGAIDERNLWSLPKYKTDVWVNCSCGATPFGPFIHFESASNQAPSSVRSLGAVARLDCDKIKKRKVKRFTTALPPGISVHQRKQKMDLIGCLHDRTQMPGTARSHTSDKATYAFKLIGPWLEGSS
jgi:hypothetical protein